MRELRIREILGSEKSFPLQHIKHHFIKTNNHYTAEQRDVQTEMQNQHLKTTQTSFELDVRH